MARALFVDDLPTGGVLVECEGCTHRSCDDDDLRPPEIKNQAGSGFWNCPGCGELLTYPEGASW